MPEFSEVQAIVNELNEKIKGRIIEGIEFGRRSFLDTNVKKEII